MPQDIPTLGNSVIQTGHYNINKKRHRMKKIRIKKRHLLSFEAENAESTRATLHSRARRPYLYITTHLTVSPSLTPPRAPRSLPFSLKTPPRETKWMCCVVPDAFPRNRIIKLRGLSLLPFFLSLSLLRFSSVSLSDLRESVSRRRSSGKGERERHFWKASVLGIAGGHFPDCGWRIREREGRDSARERGGGGEGEVGVIMSALDSVDSLLFFLSRAFCSPVAVFFQIQVCL